MTIKAAKVGRFKPACSKCTEMFSLEVVSIEPAKIKVAKLTSTTKQPTPPPPAKSPQIDDHKSSPISSLPTSVTEKTIDQAFEQSPSLVPNALGTETTIVQESQTPARNRGNLAETFVSDKTVAYEPEKTLDAVHSDQTIEHAPSTNQPTAKPSPAKSPQSQTKQPAPKVSTKNVTREMNSDKAASPSSKSERDFSVDATMDSSPATAKSQPRVERKQELSIQRLGGYRVLSELGRGGMGSVFLAKQISLDRSVALKTIQAEWASNPRVIARFIREAYAAAQLTHHNVVQIYDLGEDSGTNFFSMELVGGGSLDDVIKKKGKLDPKTAASFIAQAARGLKFAHDNGMVHRDIKPANLMLTNDGLVKVADLGLVKTPHPTDDEVNSGEDRNIMLASAKSQVTGFGSTMGTPAYMAPEQADDATSVDQRADIYSLGCTFYALLTGKPPFTSSSALEIISKHKSEPLVRPDRVVEGIPGDIANIVEKMTAKKPQDRYQDLAEVITDIEKFLGADGSRPFSPTVEHATRLKQANDDFNAAPLVKLRGWVPLAFLVLTVVLSLVLTRFNLRLAATTFLLIGFVPLAVAIVSSLMNSGSPIGSRFRALVMSSRVTDWITWGIGGLLVLVVVGVLGLIPYLLASIILAVALAFAYQNVFHKSLGKQRETAIENAEALLRELRIGGLSENAVQQFVGEYSGRNWEEFFETLFDYDTMRQLRRALSESGKAKGKQRFRAWRDKLIDRMDAGLLQKKMDREQRVLSKVERASLKASGLSDAEAKNRADDMAATMVSVATEARQTMAELSFNPQDQKAAAKRERIKAMLADARTGHAKEGSGFARRASATLMAHLFGSKLRFAIGGLLIAGCALWAKQNNFLDPANIERLKQTTEQVAAQATELAKSQSLDSVQDAQNKTQEIAKQLSQPTRPWRIVPLFDSFAPGLVGILILMSSLVYGWRYSIFAVSAAVLVMLGSSLGVPQIGPIHATWVSAGIAVALLIVGLALGRTPEKQ
jgi:eukaryotic-like serine/threonine-protein kinase